MAKKDNDLTLLLAGAALGAGAAWLASIYQSNEQRRRVFSDALVRALDEQGMRLVDANFGRALGNRAVWSVTYETPWAETRLQRVALPPEIEPYTESAAVWVASELAA